MAITTSVETITPQMAMEYLNKNTKNRRIRKDAVAMIARDIATGRFKTTHQGIAFYEDGSLADGQHRLTAIVKAGVPVEMMVTRGCKKDSMMAIDKGTARNTADILAMGNGDNDIASRALRSPYIISSINQMCRNGLQSRVKLSAYETEAIFREYKDECIWLYKIAANKTGRKISAVTGACLAAMVCGVEPSDVAKFMNVFRKYDVSGCVEKNVQAPLYLRRMIDEATLQKNRIHEKKLYLVAQNAIWHFVNNTDAQRIKMPDTQRYDISEKIGNIIRGE